MKIRNLFTVLVASAALTLAGCGTNLGSADRDSAATGLGTDSSGNKYVGTTTCIGCHEGFSWSAAVVSAYLESKHVVHSSHIEAASDSSCLGCHDPIGDGPGLEALIDAADVPDGGLAAVGCENCHGGGGEHYGVGPMPIATPDPGVCSACHDDDSHHTYHPEADFIYTNYTQSRHATASVRGGAVCVRCHTDEGGRAYKDVLTRESLNAVALPLESATAVQCRTCHNAHGGLLKEAVEAGHGHAGESAEFATCTSCHMKDHETIVVDEGGEVVEGETSLMYHEDRYYRIIADSHYDDPETTDVIEGYALDPENERVCRDCHDVHAVKEIGSGFMRTDTISGQWAQSGHGGHLARFKAEAVEAAIEDRTTLQTIEVMAAGPDGDQVSWPHYDWDASNRQSCQRCHTATGAKNFLTDPATYDPADNDFSYLDGWENDAGTITSSGQNELLYCWACHDNNSGELRDPGAITEEYDPAVIVSYPDVSSSNVCMSCHLGRDTGGVIKVTEDEDGVRSFINSHYLSAGGQLFAETGYEYDGRNYANVTFFVHDRIGLETQPGTGTGGPCVGCHMSAEAGHLFLPVEIDEGTGEITEVTASVCGASACHSGGLAGFEAQVWKDEYEGALEALRVALEGEGIFFLPSYPYFFNDENGDGIVPTPEYTFDHDGDEATDEIPEDDRGNAFKDWAGVYGLDSWQDTMGAAFNYNLLEHDPGGYAHNGFYVKGLLWDSIDFIYDGVLDDDVPEALGNLGLDAATYDAAIDYLDSARPGDAYRPALP